MYNYPLKAIVLQRQETTLDTTVVGEEAFTCHAELVSRLCSSDDGRKRTHLPDLCPAFQSSGVSTNGGLYSVFPMN